MERITAAPVRNAARRLARAVAVAALAGLAGCTALGLGGGPERDEAPQQGIPYELQLTGLDEAPDLRGPLEGASRLKTLQEDPPVSEAGLRRRLDEDIDRFQSVLRAEGYYDGSVDGRIETDRRPMQVVVDVNPGPLYRFGTLTVSYQGEDGGSAAALPRTFADAGLEERAPARSEAVLAAQARLLEALANQGRPLAKVEDRKVVVDHDARAMNITLRIDPGPPARFDGVTFSGLDQVQERYLRRLVPWREGEVFDRSALAELDRRLYQTELFESVVVQPAEAVGPAGELPATVNVVERKHRSIGAGVSYATDEGPGIELFWQHRNLFGQAEKLDLSAEASMIRQSLKADFTNPDYRRLDQDLLFGGEIARQDSEAFRSQTATVTAGLRREFSDTWSGRVGASFEYGRVHGESERIQGPSTYKLLGAPIAAERDSRNDLLDPTRGTLLTVGATPYLNLDTAGDSFVDLLASGSAYQALDDEKRFVAAVRGRLESLLGTGTAGIPATKRLYAGGGGSVRGYEFQTVGPLDDENDPIGGRSLAELGLEMRVRIGESLGVVPFVEAGIVGDSSTPDFGTRPQWAAGLGFRYYTAVGPLRADIAFPINGRRNVDDAFQIYISLGQAF